MAVVVGLLSGCVSLPSVSIDKSGTPVTDDPAPAGCSFDLGNLARAKLTAHSDQPMSQQQADELAGAVSDALGQAAASGAVVAVQNLHGTWIKAFGTTDDSDSAPMTADEHFRIGSVTKTFTGTLILQLVEQGKLSLDDTVSEFLENVPKGDEITIGMLLDMRSGIANYSINENFQKTYFAHPETAWSPEQLIQMAVELPRLFAPGKQFNYSNTNTIILGKIVEIVTGKPYADILSERIVKPLGLTNTTWPTTTDIPSPHPQGYTLQGAENGGAPVDATSWSPTFAWTAGQIISTVPDLLKYTSALATGDGLLDTDTQVERLSSFAAGSGYGYALGCKGGWIGHSGEVPGFSTVAYFDTVTGSSVAIATNSDIPSGNCGDQATLPDNDGTGPCITPAIRLLIGVSRALGHEYPVAAG